MNRAVAGAAAGLAATVPMTLAMRAAQQSLPPHQRYPLPPRRIILRATRKAGIRPHLHLKETHRRGLTWLAHYGYGTATGALFGLVAPRNLGDAVSGGIGYGLLVWAASYLGLMPALGLHPPATREPFGRNVMMVLAHAVWGASLGAGAYGIRRLQSRRTRRAAHAR
jgi:uncharacterized membrane protein YagU involved in acid resistance